MTEDPWTGMLKIDCLACGKPVGQIHKDEAEGRVLAMACPHCGHHFDYEHQEK
jgi:DNA-directed RNA polymerase subunit RPC12/RpoP